MDLAVGFFIFNRLDTTKVVFEQIKKAQPNRLYIVSDGARKSKPGEEQLVADVRNWVESNIDWECSVYKNYSDVNLGCKNRMASGITWLFENEEMAVILEDDVKPSADFFPYVKELLERYKDDENVMLISGQNSVPDSQIKNSYTFSQFSMIWGWATWRRAWNKYDINIASWGKLRNKLKVKRCINLHSYRALSECFDSVYNRTFDTWDYQWYYTVLVNNGLCIIPQYNLIENLGFNREDAVHTKGVCKYDFNIGKMNFPLKHPIEVKEDKKYDRLSEEFQFGKNMLFSRILKRILSVFKA